MKIVDYDAFLTYWSMWGDGRRPTRDEVERAEKQRLKLAGVHKLDDIPNDELKCQIMYNRGVPANELDCWIYVGDD